MGYQVKFIGDTDLPEGIDWAATRRDSGACCLFVKVTACPCGELPKSALRAMSRMVRRPRIDLEAARVDATFGDTGLECVVERGPLFELEEPSDVSEGLADAVEVGGLVAVGGLYLGLAEDLHDEAVGYAGGFEEAGGGVAGCV